MSIERDPIPQLVAQYRRLKAQVAATNREMDGVKGQLKPLVSELEGQKWQDDGGHAMMKTRKPSASYPSKAIESLAQTWAQSTDAVMKSCGEMLLTHRQEKSGYQYLEVK
jgi:hypothetical protein